MLSCCLVLGLMNVVGEEEEEEEEEVQRNATGGKGKRMLRRGKCGRSPQIVHGNFVAKLIEVFHR